MTYLSSIINGKVYCVGWKTFDSNTLLFRNGKGLLIYKLSDSTITASLLLQKELFDYVHLIAHVLLIGLPTFTEKRYLGLLPQGNGYFT